MHFSLDEDLALVEPLNPHGAMQTNDSKHKFETKKGITILEVLSLVGVLVVIAAVLLPKLSK